MGKGAEEMTTFRRTIENQIEKLENLASSENNEGREREEEKYIFAREWLENMTENLLSDEENIRADARWKFVEWLVNRGYLDGENGSEWRDDEYWVNMVVNSILNKYEEENKIE